ncbi:hypothetical protein MHBO_000724 [Bonamia ostreae]|uniref:Uncharacterized protein n=1 Tax=Bonamia ostreae TaxID=126728 RepID=A0ABV2AGN6_9EUKA
MASNNLGLYFKKKIDLLVNKKKNKIRISYETSVSDKSQRIAIKATLKNSPLKADGFFQWFHKSEDSNRLKLILNSFSDSHVISVDDFMQKFYRDHLSVSILIRYNFNDKSEHSEFCAVPIGDFGAKYYSDLTDKAKNALKSLIDNGHIDFHVFDKSDNLFSLRVEREQMRLNQLVLNESSAHNQNFGFGRPIHIIVPTGNSKTFQLFDLAGEKTIAQFKAKSHLERDLITLLLRKKFNNDQKYFDFCSDPHKQLENKSFVFNKTNSADYFANLREIKDKSSLHLDLFAAEIDFLEHLKRECSRNANKLAAENKVLLKRKNDIQNEINKSSVDDSIKDKASLQHGIKLFDEESAKIISQIRKTNESSVKSNKLEQRLAENSKSAKKDLKLRVLELEKQRSQLAKMAAKETTTKKLLRTQEENKNSSEAILKTEKEAMKRFRQIANQSFRIERENAEAKQRIKNLISESNLYKEQKRRLEFEKSRETVQEIFDSITTKSDNNHVSNGDKLDIANFDDYVDNFFLQKGF